jgi:hypothetical protein
MIIKLQIMLKTFLRIFILTTALVTTTYAGGGITHMFLATEAIAALPDAKLQRLLKDNMDAYLVGSYYPDSGYVGGANYGEDSHWDAFINAFADYLKDTYKNPAKDNPQLVAFMFGCASHRVSDEIIHGTFYHESAGKDFGGDYDKAHQASDFGIDILVMVDKNQWFNYPSSWWVPVDDLVAIYKRMGKQTYTADDIANGNAVIEMEGAGIRAIALATYPALKWVEMPWTAMHYYDWPEGGMKIDVEKIAEYQTELWEKIK